jgi:hypothetical protein
MGQLRSLARNAASCGTTPNANARSSASIPGVDGSTPRSEVEVSALSRPETDDNYYYCRKPSLKLD